MTTSNSSTKMEPVIKWSGSKRQVAFSLSRYIPEANRYFEPFIGGGAMLPFRKIKQAVAGDIIKELIDLWQIIKNEPDLLANEYKIRWEKLQNDCNTYYEVRDSFNKTKNAFDFLFLTRTCVNGLIRYNENGEFNNSLHLSRPGIHPKTLKEIILKWNYFVKEVTFSNTDYRKTLEDIRENDFVFLDPPYGGTKDRYTKTEFDLTLFYNELDRLNSKGAKWILTFDGKAGNREYDFELPKELYKHKIYTKTGNSPFTKMMRTNIDAVYESVYFNFKPVAELHCDLQQTVKQEFTMF